MDIKTVMKKIWLYLVSVCTLISCCSTTALAVSVSTPEELHQLIRANALQLRTKFSCQSSRGIMPLMPRSFWQDFAELCMAHDRPGGQSSLEMVLKKSTRLLAAHYHPKLASQLSSRERKALGIVESRIKAIIRPGMSDYDKAKAVHDDIVNRATYDERVHGDVVTMLLENRGNCESYSRLTQIMMMMAGLNCHTITGRAQRAHTWNIVWVEDGWYHVDVAWDDPITRSGKTVCRYNYFLINDSAISRTRRWNREEVPASGPRRTLYR